MSGAHRRRALVIGAGMGGLSAAAELARIGIETLVLERAPAPGGKMREVVVSGAAIDAGPTVFTMDWVFRDLCADHGLALQDIVALEPARVLASHGWMDGSRLDLHADPEASTAAIADFAGASAADGFRAFLARAADVFATLKPAYIAAQRPGPLDLVARVGLSRLPAMWRTAPFDTLWSALGHHFRDPRLRQLFARYATYCGSSPFLAPATLMLVAHVEQAGVWRVGGGMARLAEALRGLAERAGAGFRFGAHVERIVVEGGCARGVELEGGERIGADVIVFNGDASALGGGLLGDAVRPAAPVRPPAQRSLSAVTWQARARSAGFAMTHHNVFFGDDYADEFEAVFRRRTLTSRPTVYICAQDRGDSGLTGPATEAGERLLILVNAPADGDTRDFAPDIETARASADRVMRACGLGLEVESSGATAPDGFERLFPGSGGGLYGPANHGAFATFARSGARSRVPGLYLAGGSVHPGPGIPMATLSGRLAAARIARDLGLEAGFSGLG